MVLRVVVEGEEGTPTPFGEFLLSTSSLNCCCFSCCCCNCCCCPPGCGDDVNVVVVVDEWNLCSCLVLCSCCLTTTMEGEDALPAAAEDDRGERSYVAVGAIAEEASGTYYNKKCKERGVGRL